MQQVVPQPEQPGAALAGACLREDVVHMPGVRQDILAQVQLHSTLEGALAQ